MVEHRDPEKVMQIVPTLARRVQCVGPAFVKYYKEKLQGFPGIELSEDQSFEDCSEETIENVEFEDDVAFLRSLDPKEWKQQDHYAVLGT